MIQPINNGKAPKGGRGKNDAPASTVLADLDDPHRRRGTAKLLEKAVAACPQVTADEKLWGPIVKALALHARTADPRDAAGCARVLAMLRAQNADILKHLDKNDRLDDGLPTDRTEHAGTVTVRIGAGKLEYASAIEKRMGAANGNGAHR